MSDEQVDREAPNPKVIAYCTYGGEPLWTEPMIFGSLFAVGDIVTEQGKEFQVRRVAVFGETQVVNFEKGQRL